MSIKDKIIFSIMFLLIAGGAYIQFSYFQAMDKMARMEAEQIKHVDEVNKEFREDLRKLNLQFIGRGKHLRKAQEDIIVNTELIHSTADSLGSLIENVAFNLSELDREVQKHFSSIEEEISDIKDDFKSERRKNSRKLSDIDQAITTLKNDLKEIEKLEFKDPKNILISNVTAKEIASTSLLKDLLIKQIESRVRWRESVILMINKGVSQFIEIGPGKILSGLIKRTDKNIKVSAINNEEDIKLININD